MVSVINEKNNAGRGRIVPRDSGITLPRNEKQVRLICITGHIGQGHLESGVAEMVFTRDFSSNIDVSLNWPLARPMCRPAMRRICHRPHDQQGVPEAEFGKQ